MKRIKYSTLVFIMIAAIVMFSNCSDKRHPGRIYMPDMAYSRAYESYAIRDSSKFTTDPFKKGGSMIYYDNNQLPVQ